MVGFHSDFNRLSACHEQHGNAKNRWQFGRGRGWILFRAEIKMRKVILILIMAGSVAGCTFTRTIDVSVDATEYKRNLAGVRVEGKADIKTTTRLKIGGK